MTELTLATSGMEFRRAWDEPIRRFQVLGERASGTNYLHSLIQANLPLVSSAHLGWKHGFPQAQFYPRDMLVVVSVRSVQPWLRSMYRKPWHAGPSLRGLAFSDFIRAEWDTVMDTDLWRDNRLNEMMLEPASRWIPGLIRDRVMVRIENRLRRARKLRPLSPQAERIALGTPLQYDRDPITGAAFPNVLALRSAKSRAYLGHRNRVCNLALVQYEAAKSRPETVIRELAAAFGLPAHDPVKPIDTWLGELTETQAEVGHVPPKTIPEDDLAFIRAALDPEVERELGYPMP